MTIITGRSLYEARRFEMLRLGIDRLRPWASLPATVRAEWDARASC